VILCRVLDIGISAGKAPQGAPRRRADCSNLYRPGHISCYADRDFQTFTEAAGLYTIARAGPGRGTRGRGGHKASVEKLFTKLVPMLRPGHCAIPQTPIAKTGKSAYDAACWL